MSKRTSKVLPKNVTQAQYNEAMADYAKSDAKIETINSKLDAKIAALREKEAPALADLTAEKEVNFNVIEAYCNENSELFENAKSIENAHGKVGYRTGTPKLKLNKSTWAKSLGLIKKHLPKYVRTKEEPAKDLLLADRNEKDMNKKFVLCKIMVEQDERFFIDLKKEEVETA